MQKRKEAQTRPMISHSALDLHCDLRHSLFSDYRWVPTIVRRDCTSPVTNYIRNNKRWIDPPSMTKRDGTNKTKAEPRNRIAVGTTADSYNNTIGTTKLLFSLGICCCCLRR